MQGDGAAMQGPVGIEIGAVDSSELLLFDMA
jgi:hypothetical protein